MEDEGDIQVLEHAVLNPHAKFNDVTEMPFKANVVQQDMDVFTL